MSESLKTPLLEQASNVEYSLKARGGPWGGIPDYSIDPNGDKLHEKTDQVMETLLTETDVDPQEVAKRGAYTHANIDRINTDIRTVPYIARRAFFVTRREYETGPAGRPSESDPFAPVAASDMRVTPYVRTRMQTGWQPTVLATYKGNGGGVLLLPPLSPDMYTYGVQDPNVGIAAGDALKSAVTYAKHMGVRAIGLGALLPKITNFGASIRAMEDAKDMITTTGHGGTVYLIAETVKKVMKEVLGEQETIGVIGAAGSIGRSSTAVLLSDTSGRPLKILAQDKAPDRLYEHLKEAGNERISVAQDVIDVLRNTNIIVTAVTTSIDLDEIDPDGIQERSLQGKVIIDDSQPGSFDKVQVEARGGTLLWVVGEDKSKTRFAARQGGLTYDGTPYNYGDGTGLAGQFDVFGCEAEVAALARLRKYEAAIQGPVTPEMVERIGRMMGRVGIEVADFQSFGAFVDLRHLPTFDPSHSMAA